MTRRKPIKRFDKKAIRNWTLYVIRLNGDHYYIGITSRIDFMRRINQHGSRWGAKVNVGNVVEEIIEVQHLGNISGLRAGKIENNVMLQYRKRYGARKVRGGYYIYKKTAIIPTYTPGSPESIIFIAACLVAAVIFLVVMASYY